MKNEFKVGEVVYIAGGYRNSVRIGETATVVRKGHAAYWVRFQDGVEMVWRSVWLNKMGGENGIIRSAEGSASINCQN